MHVTLCVNGESEEAIEAFQLVGDHLEGLVQTLRARQRETVTSSLTGRTLLLVAYRMVEVDMAFTGALSAKDDRLHVDDDLTNAFAVDVLSKIPAMVPAQTI